MGTVTPPNPGIIQEILDIADELHLIAPAPTLERIARCIEALRSVHGRLSAPTNDGTATPPNPG